MNLTALKSWVSGETLTAADLNAEFQNIYTHTIDNNDIDSTASYVLGELVIGTGLAAADGGQLHVHTGSAGTVQAASDADEAVFENSTASGITILSGLTSTGKVAFGDSGDNDIGLITYNHATDAMTLTTNGTTALTLSSAQAATFAGDVTVGGALTLTGGITLNGNTTIGDSSADTLTVNSTITSNLIFTDNTYDIGASGATRPRDLFLSRNAVMGGTLGVTGLITATGGVSGALTGNVTGNVTGNLTGNVTGNVTGDVTGDVTGNLTGNVTGNVTGNLTGDVTGNISGNVTGGTISGTTGTFSGDLAVRPATNENVNVSSFGSGDLRIAALNDAGSSTVQLSIQADPLYIRGTGGVIKSAFLGNGNVGIGTSSPADSASFSRALDVNGPSGAAVYVRTNGSASDYGYIGHYGTTAYFVNASAGPMAFYTNGSERARIDASGNMGLGVAPSVWQSTWNAYEVGSTALWSRVGTDGYLSTNIYYDTAANYKYLNNGEAALYSQNGSEHRWRYAVSGTAGSTISLVDGMRLTTTGLGIGTTSPSHTLDVNGSMQIERNGSSPLLRFTDTSSSSRWIGIPDGSSRFAIYGTNGSTEELVLDSSGLVGIGTSSPAAQNILTLQDDTNGFVGIRFNGTGSYAHNWSLYGSGDGAGNEFFGVYDATNGAYRLKIQESGDVAIGRDNYTNYRFTVQSADSSSSTFAMQIQNSLTYGLLQARSDGQIATGAYTLSPYNNTTASAANMYVDSSGILYRSTSSAKYKTGVETIEDSYADAILNMRPVWYRSLSEGDNANHGWWGFIAEEVAEIDPRLVQYRTTESVISEESGREETVTLDEPIPEGVSYDRFVPLLLNLIQRQQQSIATLETKVAALEAA